MIADLEARIILLTDDLFYARASVARLTVDLEQANRQLAHRDAEIAMLRATSDKSDDKPAERPTYETLERENAALREVIKSNIIDIGQLSEEAVTLREDKERLDWLEKNKFQHRDFNTGDSLGYEWCVSSSYEDEICVRAAIDAARKEAQP